MQRADAPGPIDRAAVGLLTAVALVAAALRGVRLALFERAHRDDQPGEELDPQGPNARIERSVEAKGGVFAAVGARVPFLRPALAVHVRFGELNGDNLASAVTLRMFLSLFPLLLVVVAVVGFFEARSGTGLAMRLIGELGLRGEAAELVTDTLDTARRSRRTAGAIGLAGLLWSGLGLVAAFQAAFNQAWQVGDRGVKGKLFAVAWLAGAAVLFLASAAMTTAARWLPAGASPAAIVLGFVTSVALWLWTAKILTNNDVGWRSHLPGAVVGAIGLEILKVVGAFYVPRTIASSSELYGSLGVIFAVVAWLLFFGRLVVYTAVTSVVAYEKRHGTVTALIELPRQPHMEGDVTRSGREDRRT